MRLSPLSVLAIAVSLLLSPAPTFASVSGFRYATQNSTIRNPSVTLVAGTAGSSKIDAVAPIAATATTTAGLTFYETANAPASCSPPTVDTGLTAPGSTGSYTISPYTYVSITVTNSQTSATAAKLQVLLNVDFLNYQAYLRSDVGNIRFYSSTSLASSSELYAWLEAFAGSTTANAATSSAVWVMIPTSIPASSATTIYMVFLPTTTTFDGVYWGEASDLSATYGQYDNAANVFLYYNNGGTSTGFAVVNGGSLGVTSMADPYGITTNVLSLAGSGSTTTSSETVAWHTTGVVGDNFIIDGWVDILGTTDGSTYNANALYAARGASSSTTTNYILGLGWTGTESSIAYESGTTNTVLATSGTRATGWTWSTSSIAGTALSNHLYTSQSYMGGTSISSTTATNGNLGAANTYLGIANWAGASGKSYFYQWKVRVYPPNGVMPTAAYAAVVSNPASACLISPQFTAASTIYADSWIADVWGSALSSGTLSVSIYIVSSSGGIISALASGAATGTIGVSKGEVKTAIAGSAGSVAGTNYLEMVFTAPTTGSLAVTLYWGAGQSTNFRTPSTYVYVLVVNNLTTASWTISMGTMTSMATNLGRLTNVTVWLVNPSNVITKQIVVTNGALTQTSGGTVALAASGTLNIALAAYASALPTSSNSPSTITASLVVQSSSSTALAQYTINLVMN